MKYLMIIAHPDDELLGFGGTLLKILNDSSNIVHIILCCDISSSTLEIDEERKSISRVLIFKDIMQKIGVDHFYILNFPILKLRDFHGELCIEFSKIISNFKPDVVFCHDESDIHIDHKEVFRSSLVSCRPKEECSIKRLLTFKITDSNFWNFKNLFIENYFYDITNTVSKKIELLELYKSESPKSNFHPRAIENILNEGRVIGSKIGVKYAEGFNLIFSKEN